MAKKETTVKENSSPLADVLKAGFSTTIGRIPSSLAFIFLAALITALLSGLVLSYTVQNRKSQNEFLPLRLEKTEGSVSNDLQALEGYWILRQDAYAMSLFIEGNKFEWIIRTKETGDTQFYARGNYKTDGDVMVMGQRPDMGKPHDPQKPWVINMPIAMVNVNLFYSLEGKKKMKWVFPVSEQERILSHSSAIFIGNPDGEFIWTKQ